MSIKAAELYVSIGADPSEAVKGLKQVDLSFSDVAKHAAIASTAVAAGLTAALGSAVTTAAGFEETMSGLKAVMSPAEVTAFGGALEGLALRLGKDTAFSAREAAGALEELVKGGVSVQDILDGAAESTLNLAAAGGVNLKDAATIAANALAQFNLDGSQMAHVSDLIAGAANASALDVGHFQQSLQAAGAVAATVGFSIDDLAQGIAIMGKAGITGSDAGTSLKTMMMSLTPSSKAAAEAMKDLGIITADGANQFFDASGKVKSMAEVAGILEAATADLTEQQKLATLQTIFGSDAIRAAAVLAKEGAGGFNEMAESMGKVSAAAVGAARMDNLNGSLKALGGSIETVQIAIGQALTPAIRQVVETVTGLVNRFLELSPQAQRFTAWAMVAATAVAGVSAAAFGLLAVLPSVAAGFGVASAAAGVVAGVLTGPVLLAIGAVVAAGLALYKAWDTNFLGIQETTFQVVEKVTEFMQAQFGKVIEWTEENWPLIQATVDKVMGAVDAVVSGTLAAVAAFWRDNGESIMAVVRTAWTIVSTVISTTLDNLLATLTLAMQVINGDWSGAWETFQGMVVRTWAAVGTIIEAGADLALQLVSSLVGALADLAGSFFNTARNLGAQIVEGMLQGLDRLLGAVRGVVSTVNDLLGSIRMPDFGGLVDRARSAASSATSALGGIAGRASGGPVFSGTPYMVGERGPELFVPSGGGYIVPNHALRSGGGTTEVHNHITITGNTFLEDSHTTKTRLARMLKPHIEAAVSLRAA